MDPDFWRGKWRDPRQGWRQPEANPLLVRHLPALGLDADARIFAPLCGDSVDLVWLHRAGFRVAGAELVSEAVERLFAALALTPSVTPVGGARLYAADTVEIYAGDLFALDAAALGPFDAVYDRAALVALPPETRPAYAGHIGALTGGAARLLVTFDYDQRMMEGPPFSVPEEEVRGLYDRAYAVRLLESVEVEGGLKGFCPATERAWSLSPRA